MGKMQKIIPVRTDFKYLVPMTTRWHDNDIYGHVNNVVYYTYFDSAVNVFLIKEAGLDIHEGLIIGLVVQSECNYHAPIAFPAELDVGVGVAKLGTSSVTYRLAIFRNDEEIAVADGCFTHVFVDRNTRKPVPIPTGMRAALENV